MNAFSIPSRSANSGRHGRLGMMGTTLTGIALIAGVNVVLLFFYPTLSWESVPFHSAIEAIGSLAAISMAVFLLMLREHRKEGEAYLWLACGLLAMGMIDAFHASVPPVSGTGFVWLHSTSTLAGGALFACVWVPASLATARWTGSLPKIVAVAAAAFGALSIAYPELRPPMTAGAEFTPAAIRINLAGGLLFLAAMVYFMLHYRSSRDPDDVLFANLCLLFGASGLLFSLSQVWRADWWFWHLLRVLAYFIAFAYVFVVFRRAQTNLAYARSQLEADVVELASTNRTLEAEVAERARAEEEVRNLNQELDRRVTERTAQLEATVEALRVEAAERKKIEEKARVASLYARSLIEASLDPLVTISADGKITDVNEASIKATGIPRDELIGTDFSNYFTEPEQAREGYRQVFARGFVTDYPLTIRRRDGKLADVLYNASVYEDEAGKVQGVFAAARDVTESKRVMREFIETKSFLDNILQSSIKYSIIGEDLSHSIVSWNEGARRNYGYATEDILAKNSKILHRPEDIESGAVERLMATAYEKGLAEGEFERVRKDGSRFVASIVVTRRNDASGNPIGYLLMSSDISEKKRAEEQLRFASQYARSLIEASLDPLVTISPEGKITDVNEASIKATGIARDELIGTDFSDYFTEPEKAREGYRQVFARGFVTDYALTIRRRNGKLTDVLYNASVYRNEAGEVQGVFAAARDITKQREAEAALRVEAEERRKASDALELSSRDLARSNAELEQFAYVASHDLQEPLRMVVGYVQLLKKRLADKLDADTREFMGFAVDGALRMQNLIQDILAYSRVSSKGQPLAPVDSAAALKEALDLLARRIAETGAKVDAQSLPVVMADRTQLAQLFQNLIDNGIKFCKDRAPRIRVEAAQEAGRWRFSVADNGIGIAPEYRKQIFGIFQRLHTRREYPGTGIGLAICKRIVERHGGEIGVEPAPGGGSVFWFALPQEENT